MAEKKKTTNNGYPRGGRFCSRAGCCRKMELYEKMTGLKLNKNCHFDKEFATCGMKLSIFRACIVAGYLYQKVLSPITVTGRYIGVQT